MLEIVLSAETRGYKRKRDEEGIKLSNWDYSDQVKEVFGEKNDWQKMISFLLLFFLTVRVENMSNPVSHFITEKRRDSNQDPEEGRKETLKKNEGWES